MEEGNTEHHSQHMKFLYRFRWRLKKQACRPRFQPQTNLDICARRPGPSKGQCTTKHMKPFMPRQDGVLHEVALSCRRVNVEQTRQFLPQCLKECSHSLRVGTGSNVAVHCKACNCFPRLSATKVPKQHQGTRDCESYDIWAIERCGKHCVARTVSY